MESRSKNSLATSRYRKPTSAIWKGRTEPESKQYWHEFIELAKLPLYHTLQPDATHQVGLIGYACDEGVRRNHGNIGAQFGPEELRKALTKLPVHFKHNVFDFGDVLCLDGNMEDAQIELSSGISQLLNQNIFPIAIGGGHDIAYATFSGVANSLTYKNSRIGIINFDAHFDLRTVNESANSGTSFSQIANDLKQKSKPFDYMVLGIQKQSNSSLLFEQAKALQVDIVNNTELQSSDLKLVKGRIEKFLDTVEVVYITVDLDCLSSAFAPGVSAPSAFGIDPNTLFELLEFIFSSQKVVACDLAELNPSADPSGNTSKLAARILDFIVSIC